MNLAGETASVLSVQGLGNLQLKEKKESLFSAVRISGRKGEREQDLGVPLRVGLSAVVLARTSLRAAAAIPHAGWREVGNLSDFGELVSQKITKLRCLNLTYDS